MRKDKPSEKTALLTLRDGAWQVTKLEGARHGPPSCAYGADGSAWVLLDELYRMSPDGVVSRVSLPTLPPLAKPIHIEVDPSTMELRVIEEPPRQSRTTERIIPLSVRKGADGAVWISGIRDREEQRGMYDLPIDKLTRRVLLRVGPQPPGTPIDWDTIAPLAVENMVKTFNLAPSLGRFPALP